MQLYGSDLALARRLESAEAANGFAMTEAFDGAESIGVLGGCAMFAGVGSPMTHALGTGMETLEAGAEFDRMERFYFDRGSDCLVDLCPMCDPQVFEEVARRGYTLVEFNNVMARPVLVYDRQFRSSAEAGARLCPPEEMGEWSRTLALGFTGLEEVDADTERMIGAIGDYGEAFLANGGAAAMSVQNGVAMLYGDATVEGSRNRGLQSALIRARLAHASELGAEFAMACVLPGSGSQRNYERAGFQLVYMRVNLKRVKP